MYYLSPVQITVHAENQTSYKEDSEDGGCQDDDDHPIKARCILSLHHSYVPDQKKYS